MAELGKYLVDRSTMPRSQTRVPDRRREEARYHPRRDMNAGVSNTNAGGVSKLHVHDDVQTLVSFLPRPPRCRIE